MKKTQVKKTKTARIQGLLALGKSQAEIAKSLKVSRQLVYQVARKTRENSEFVSKIFEKVKLRKPSKIIKQVEEAEADLDRLRELGVIQKGKPYMKAAFERPRIITHSQFAKDALDLVNHPPHYRSGGIETIDFIEAKDLNYRLGNVVKYVSRAGRKDTDPIEDLEKAAWYLQREINARKNA